MHTNQIKLLKKYIQKYRNKHFVIYDKNFNEYLPTVPNISQEFSIEMIEELKNHNMKTLILIARGVTAYESKTY